MRGIDTTKPPIYCCSYHTANKTTGGFDMPEKPGLGKTYLTELSPSDASLDRSKAASQEVANLYSLKTTDGFIGFFSGARLVSFDKYASKIEQCGSWLRFAQTSDDKLKLSDARFCKIPNCPMCQQRRSAKWRAKFLTLVPQIRENYPTHKWLFLTLTIRNCELDDLRPTLRHLNESFRRLSQLKRFPMEGLVKSVEVTRVWDCYHQGTYLGRHGTKWVVQWELKSGCKLDLEPTTEVHPHLHVCGLVAASYFTGRCYIKQDEWTDLWQQSLRVDYKPIVNIKAVKPKKNQKLLPTPEEFEKDPNADETGLVIAICETLKYTVKEQDLVGVWCPDETVNSQWLKLLTQQLYKTRRIEYRGTLKELGKELEAAYEDDDLIHINEDDEFTEDITKELVFAWDKAISRYVLSQSFDKE